MSTSPDFTSVPQSVTSVYVKVSYSEWMASLRVGAHFDIDDDSNDHMLKEQNKNEQHKSRAKPHFEKMNSTATDSHSYTVTKEKHLPGKMKQRQAVFLRASEYKRCEASNTKCDLYMTMDDGTVLRLGRDDGSTLGNLLPSAGGGKFVAAIHESRQPLPDAQCDAYFFTRATFVRQGRQVLAITVTPLPSDEQMTSLAAMGETSTLQRLMELESARVKNNENHADHAIDEGDDDGATGDEEMVVSDADVNMSSSDEDEAIHVELEKVLPSPTAASLSSSSDGAPPAKRAHRSVSSSPTTSPLPIIDEMPDDVRIPLIELRQCSSPPRTPAKESSSEGDLQVVHVVKAKKTAPARTSKTKPVRVTTTDAVESMSPATPPSIARTPLSGDGRRFVARLCEQLVNGHAFEEIDAATSSVLLSGTRHSALREKVLTYAPLCRVMRGCDTLETRAGIAARHGECRVCSTRCDRMRVYAYSSAGHCISMSGAHASDVITMSLCQSCCTRVVDEWEVRRLGTPLGTLQPCHRAIAMLDQLLVLVKLRMTIAGALSETLGKEEMVVNMTKTMGEWLSDSVISQLAKISC